MFDYLKKIRFQNHNQENFFIHFFELVVEGFALKKYRDFKDIPINILCFKLVDNPSNLLYNHWGFYEYKKSELNDLIITCSIALEQIEKDFKINDLILQFYFEKMCKVFDIDVLPSFFNSEPKVDDNGLPIEIPKELREYIVSLLKTFTTTTELKPTQKYIKNLSTEFLISKYKHKYKCNYIKWKVPQVLQNIIMGKCHKGANLFSFFFFRIPKHEQITQSFFLPQSFLRLCYAHWGNLILLEDDIESVDFKLAVLDLIPFMDRDNKILWDNKLMQYRHNYVAKTIEDAFLAEIEKRYN